MDIRQYIGKKIIAWLSYNENYEHAYGRINTVCYVSPRFLYNCNTYESINSDDFPKSGKIEVSIQGGDTAEDVFNKLGSLVCIKINKRDIYPSDDGNYAYTLRYNSQYGRENSEIWIEKISGNDFYQIIDVPNDISLLQKERKIPIPNYYTLFTTHVLLRCSAKKIYGPYEYDFKYGDNESFMELRGLKDYQYIVSEYNSLDCNDELLVVENQNNDEAIALLPKYVPFQLLRKLTTNLTGSLKKLLLILSLNLYASKMIIRKIRFANLQYIFLMMQVIDLFVSNNVEVM